MVNEPSVFEPLKFYCNLLKLVGKSNVQQPETDRGKTVLKKKETTEKENIIGVRFFIFVIVLLSSENATFELY